MLNVKCKYIIKDMDSRLEAMIGLYLDGNSLAKVGRYFGLTRERVRQIVSEDPRYIERRDAKKRLIAKRREIDERIRGYSK